MKSTTARKAGPVVSLAFALAVAGACTSFYEIPIETPIQPKLNVSEFQRVLIVGFISGGSEDVDANLETVRLLRSQLRTKSALKVIDAEVLPLAEIAADQLRSGSDEAAGAPGPQQAETRIRSQKDLQPYERIFADVSFWKKIGEEYQGPLIVTGTILFTPHARSGWAYNEREYYDSFGRRQVQTMRTLQEKKGFILEPKFIFIDGRSGAQMYQEQFREENLYDVQQNTPALSSYFELMDRMIPSFLSTLSTQKIRGTRVLLK
jgi:hypothetical protein